MSVVEVKMTSVFNVGFLVKRNDHVSMLVAGFSRFMSDLAFDLAFKFGTKECVESDLIKVFLVSKHELLVYKSEGTS